ncbi:hypothetical protein ANCDUO_13932 [Ancylostoma duodenale]|uniref:Uncharacterized protein n=1 Tax=Ancylostoma duodenale TaxID=51022 RepID=A0A0C2GAI1_9BILA|nr:hypothetical protein ANCDUO_13932 [Ancylostoma duodenale]
MDCPTYVQINIYNTTIEALREKGVDIECFLKSTGCPSVSMNIPILDMKSCESTRVIDMRCSKPRECTVEESNNGANANTDESDEIAPAGGRHTSEHLDTAVCIKGDADAEEIFQDCIEGYEEDDIPPKSLGPVAVTNNSLKTCATATSFLLSHDNENEEPLQRDAVQMATSVGVPELMSEQQGEDEESPIVANHDEKNGVESVVGAEASGVLEHLNSNTAPVHCPEKSLSNANEVFNSLSLESNRQRRKRARRSSAASRRSVGESIPKILNESSALQAKCKGSSQPKSHIESVFECKFPGCVAKMTWKPRYGKNRLVEHVRNHWSKNVKKCNICSFSAPCWRKVYFHHKRIHGDVEFNGVVSLE